MLLRHLLEQGLTKTAIAAQLDVSRRVIYHWLKTGQIDRDLDGPVPPRVRRLDGERAHFLTLSYWTDLDAIRAFAGPDIERAKYYPEDKDVLLEFEPTVTHYEVSEAH